MGEEEKRKKRVMVTFDVDGTLIKSTGSSSNRLHRQAFSHAFYHVFGLKDVSIDAIQVASERLPDLKARMIEYAKEHAQNIGEGLEVLPGVSSLLDALSSKGVAIELIKIAANRANKLYPDGFDLRVHVGDTPNDIRAAENGGALAIGVCTGVFTAEELQKASNGNAVILPDLTNAEAFLKLLGI
ncbi:hypothetical protein IEQ34_022301 [Dendrobium chrysotoxum]|uniref:HAD family hydrolase n=1 Tax=Dendrobium chrysotoxum TaxID=161865 RepID=A0AAV7FWR0_DENCH|nr:hypothetical protein IEQ34_022301 [Dendrobium chrysotoxum]